jgi:hypothetical protein
MPGPITRRNSLLVRKQYGHESAAKAAWNGARVELPDADPHSRPELPKTRLDEMLARRQLTDSEYHLALMFKAEPCGTKVLNGYYFILKGIVLEDRAAGDLADSRVGRSKGVAEVMRKLRHGLRLMVDHYLPDSDDEDDKREGYGTLKWRTLMAKQLWSANMHRASAIKQAWRSMPSARRKMMVTDTGGNDMPKFIVRSTIK